MPFHDRIDSRLQLARSRPLEEIGGGAGFERLADIGRIGVHGHEDQFHFRGQFVELPSRIDPVEEGHRDIQQNQVGTQAHRGFQQRTSVLDGAHDFTALFDDAAEAFED